MNYRHAYHAGNFADVVKHAVLALVIEHLKRKASPFRVIDTHAGIGGYDLRSDSALKTQEWKNGIGRLLGPDAAPLPDAIASLLAPYLDVVRSMNRPGAIERYPGSPLIARALLRPQDRLVANELHPDDAAALRSTFARERQVKVLEMDGWTALKSLLPPKERRGVVLVDPPFEEPGEMERMATGLEHAVRRFATGIYLLWYPIKDLAARERFEQALIAAGHKRLLKAELTVRGARSAPTDVDGRPLPGRLSGAGLIMLNPPYQLDSELSVLLPALAAVLGAVLGDTRDATGSISWLAGGHGPGDQTH